MPNPSEITRDEKPRPGLNEDQLRVLREVVKLGEQNDEGMLLAAARKLLAEVDRLRKRVKQCAVWYVDEEPVV
jgi:hypothetical protein